MKLNYLSSHIKLEFVFQFFSKTTKKNKFGILVLILLMQGCTKDKVESIEIVNPIVSAKNALAQASKSQKIASSESYRLNLTRTIDWERALSKQMGDSVMVYAPIQLSQDLTIRDGGKVGLSINTISWLVVSQVKGKYDFSVLMKVPDSDMRSNDKFKGVMLVDDWFGKKQSYYIELGKKTENRTNGNGTVTMEVVCKAISYTICAGEESAGCTRTDNYCKNVGNPGTELSMDPDYQTTGGGGGGGISSSDGTNPSKEITNNIVNICLKNATNSILNSNVDVKGVIADILSKFGDKNNGIKINIIDGDIYYNNGGIKPGQTSAAGYNQNGFSATITLNPAYFKDTSVEDVASTIIHEFVHAYLVYENVDLSTAQNHDKLAAEYVTPMATYLHDKFGMSKLSAYSLAWSGLSDSKVMVDAKKNGDTALFTMDDGTTFSFNDIVSGAAPYRYQGDGSKGKPICD